MTRATLSMTLPDRVWVGQVSRAHPEATFRVLAVVPGDDAGFALVRIAGPDVPDVVAEMEGHNQIAELSPIGYDGDGATVRFETSAPLLLVASREAGLPLEPPIEIRNGEATLEVTGSCKRLSEFATRLETFGIEYQVERVHEPGHEDRLLSDRQRETVVAAVEHGYYDTPRRCSLTELADRLGVAKSTCSETLHRAEGAIVKRFVADLPAVEGVESTHSAE